MQANLAKNALQRIMYSIQWKAAYHSTVNTE